MTFYNLNVFRKIHAARVLIYTSEKDTSRIQYLRKPWQRDTIPRKTTAAGYNLQYLRKWRQREITLYMTSPEVYHIGLFTRWLRSVNIWSRGPSRNYEDSRRMVYYWFVLFRYNKTMMALFVRIHLELFPCVGLFPLQGNNSIWIPPQRAIIVYYNTSLL